MSLVWPLALLGLLTIPVILLLHLLRNRREAKDIPSLLFWRGLEREQRGGKPRLIPLSLLLILQLLTAVALTCGLARPIFSFALDQPEQTIFVLDMTTSMTAVDVPQSEDAGRAVQRFDLAREIIKSQVQEMDENDRVVVVSLTPQPEILMSGDAGQRARLLSTLDNLVPGATGANLTAALSLANGLADPNQINQIVVLTDGNYSMENQPLPTFLAPIEWRFIPDTATPNIANLALLNVSTRLLPDGRQRIFARVVNYWDTPAIRTLRLWADGDIVDEDPVEIEAQADATKIWTLPSATETVAVEIVETDILPLDNRAELLLLNQAHRRVLLVSEGPEMLTKVLAAQPGVELTLAASDWNDFDLAEFDLVIFDSLPEDLTSWPPGNVLVINPPLGHPLLPADNYARNVRPDLTSASSLLTGIDLSGVYFGRTLNLTVPGWAEIDLTTTAGESEQAEPLIFQGAVNNSRIMVWAFDLAASNLPARLALPLLMANTLSTLLAPSLPAAIPIGEAVVLGRNFHVETPDGQRLFMEINNSAVRYAHAFDRTKKPGIYRIYDTNNVLVAGFAVHAGSPLESRLNQRGWQADTLQVTGNSILPAPDPEMDHQDFWPWFAGFALVIIVVEGWLAWRR
jgi:hypothetical protein